MTGTVSRLSGRLLNQIRVNHVHTARRDGVPIVIKRRRRAGTVLIWFGNHLLGWADSGMCMFLRVEDWLRWEARCFALLYPDRPAVRVERGRDLVIPRLDGISLRVMLDRGDTAVEQAFVMAARELRRVHGIVSGDYRGPWSHGDLHLDNILCDMSAERAYVIDFDIRHDLDLDHLERQADDLRSVLLELMGRRDDQWCVLATRFLAAYGHGEVLEGLRRQLVIPRGFARVLFHIKTNGAPVSRVRPRLEALQRVLRDLAGVTS